MAAPRLRVDTWPSARVCDEDFGNMYSHLGREALTVFSLAPFGRLLDGHGGVRRAARRVLDRLETEDGADTTLSELLDPTTEAPGLLYERVECAGDLEQVLVTFSRIQDRAQECYPSTLPADGYGCRWRDRRQLGWRRGWRNGTRRCARGGPARQVLLQAEFLDAGPDSDSREAELNGSARDIPVGPLESRPEIVAHGVRGVRRRGRRVRGGLYLHVLEF